MRKYQLFLPNIIILLRFILTVPFMLILANQLVQDSPKVPALLYIFLVLIYLTDFLDGAVARDLKAESTLGSILDISFDSLFIFSSLIIFNFFGVLPVWFTMIVLVNLLTFLTTSRFLISINSENKRRVFVFDMTGRISAVIFYLIPAGACAAFSNPSNQSHFILNAALYSSVILACISMSGRLLSCFAPMGAR